MPIDIHSSFFPKESDIKIAVNIDNDAVHKFICRLDPDDPVIIELNRKLDQLLKVMK